MLDRSVPIVRYVFFPPSRAMFISIALVLAGLNAIGVHLEKLSKRSVFVSAARTVVFGVLVAAVAYLARWIIVPA